MKYVYMKLDNIIEMVSKPWAWSFWGLVYIDDNCAGCCWLEKDDDCDDCPFAMR